MKQHTLVTGFSCAKVCVLIQMLILVEKNICFRDLLFGSVTTVTMVI